MGCHCVKMQPTWKRVKISHEQTHRERERESGGERGGERSVMVKLSSFGEELKVCFLVTRDQSLVIKADCT